MDKKEMLKSWIKRLHDGEDPNTIKKEFKTAFADLSSEEISRAEDELIKEGMSVDEVHSLCDVHLAAFKDALGGEGDIAPEGHPIHTLMAEHTLLLEYAGKLVSSAGNLKTLSGYSAAEKELKMVDHLIEHFKDSEKHYLREENVLFPYVEKHGMAGPPKVMWMEHDSIRGIKKKLYPLVENRSKLEYAEFSEQLERHARSLQEMLSSHFYKENNILFPASMNLLSSEEWEDVSSQFLKIGYCCFSPKTAKTPEKVESGAMKEAEEGEIVFETGHITVNALEAMLNTLPVEITYIDEKDSVRYFSQPKDMIFTRSKAVIGNLVQNCHPQKSVHLVNKIIDTFRSGQRDVAEFWIDMKGKKVYIRYFAVRDNTGKYLGCVEVTQDISPLQKIQGERRLLDWS